MTFCLMTFCTSIFDRWCWTPWPMTPRFFTSPTFDSTDLSPYRSSTRDLWPYDLWHHNLWPEWPSTSQPFIFALWVSSHVYYFGPTHASSSLIFHLWITGLSFPSSDLWPHDLLFDDLWHQHLWPDDGGHHDLWHKDLSPHRLSTPLTFHPTDLRPVTFDTTTFDTIIFDLNDPRLLNLSSLPCDFPAMFIILDRSTPLHHWYFTFAFLAFDFQVLTCDLMTFCLMTFGTSIFHRWWWTPWLMTQRSFTSPTFDSTNLSPYRPSTSDLWHYDHNYTIIFDLSDLRHLNLSFLTCEFHAMLLFWTDPRIFITDISPLTSWPLIFKFWPVTPWGFAWWPLVPACLTHDVGHHDLWHQDLSPDRPSTPLTFRLTDLRLHWPFPLRTFDPWPLTLRP